MGKLDVSCPHCGKGAAILLEDKDEAGIKKVKGADWFPLLKRVGENEWTETWQNGVALLCKCERVYFATGLEEGVNHEIMMEPPEEYSVPLFCRVCGKSFISSDRRCPMCGRQF